MRDFLDKGNKIVENYERQEKESGEQFNLFSILDRETDEEKTHSAFIAELLNPQGSHGQGSVFLKLLVELLSEKREISALWEKSNTPTSNEIHKMQVYTERNVGKYRKNECRLDILLINSEWQILIENKFNAKQGEEQLERYSDYLKEDLARRKLLIYLTKTGEKYKSKELSEGTDYFCLTYKDDILDWLDKCKKHCKNTPLLEQSLAQYINLIKRETNQTINDKMKSEIQELILKRGIKGASEIVKNYEKTLKFIVDDLRKKVINKLKVLYDLRSIRKQDEPFFSIFLTINKLTIGIESFNVEKKSHRKNSLFIGELDFEKRSDPKNRVHTFWIKKSIEDIWNENEKFDKLNEYGKCEDKRDEIAQEIVDYIQDYITRITKE